MPFWREALCFAGYKPFDFRIERLIALARVALAAFTVLAIYLDPSDPHQGAQATFVILIGYLVLALIVTFAVMSGHLRAAWHLPLHLTDIGFVTVLMYLFEGPAGPFFVFYTFILLAGTLRWDWRGALWTTAGLFVLTAILALATAMGLQPTLEDPDSQLNRVIIRATFLLIAGGMLVSYGIASERSRDLLMRLSAWPSPSKSQSGTNYCPELTPALSHVAAVMSIPRILVMWEQSEEPGVNAVVWANGQCRQLEHFDHVLDDMLAPELAGKAFQTGDGSRNTALTSEGLQRCQGPIFDRAMVDEFQIRSAVTAAFTGLICRGRLFLLDRGIWREDDLVAAEIVAARIGIELEHYTLRSQLEEGSAIRERARLARDLHDGLLQSLTAAGLQLKSAVLRAKPESQAFLENLRVLLAGEQRRVRSFITTRPARSSYLLPEMPLAPIMSQLQTKLELLWGCAIEVTLIPEDVTIPRRLAPQIDLILAESVANAVHHGHATHVDVTVETSAGTMALQIRDNGIGLEDEPETDDQAELTTLVRGPVSLQSRVAELNGSIAITSSPSGTVLDIKLPLRAGLHDR